VSDRSPSVRSSGEAAHEERFAGRDRASNTLTEPCWPETTILSGDVATAIGELTANAAQVYRPAGRPQYAD
jgi:hypothetical protein